MDTKRRSYDIFDVEERVHALELGGGDTPEPTSWDYSTTETATGQKWIDGSEIYCRVFDNLNKTLSDWTDLGVDASAVNKIVDGYVIGNDTGKGQCIFNVDIFAASSNKLWILKHGNFSVTVKTAVIFYTKTEATKKRSTKK